MKEKLSNLVRSLAQRHYSTDTILRAILLPTQTEETEKVMDELITVIEQTINEKELCLEIEKMEEKYLQT